MFLVAPLAKLIRWYAYLEERCKRREAMAIDRATLGAVP